MRMEKNEEIERLYWMKRNCEKEKEPAMEEFVMQLFAALHKFIPKKVISHFFSKKKTKLELFLRYL